MITPCITDAASAEAALGQARRLSRSGLPQLAYARALAVHDWATACGPSAADATSLLADSAYLLGWCCFMMASYESGITFCRTARDVWQRQGALPRQARACSVLSWLLASIGEQDAVSEALMALDLAERSGDREERAWALNANGVVLWLLKQPDRALPFSRQAVAMTRDAGRADTNALINLAGVEVEIGLAAAEAGDRAALEAAVARGIAMTKEALAQARADGDGWQERLAICNVAEYELHVDAFDQAARTLQAYDTAAGEPTDRCRAHYLHMLGRTRLGQGATEDALLTLLAARDIALRVNDVETASGIHRELSRAYALLGRFEQALAAHLRFHELYVRQASEAAQRRARTYALQWEADQLRAVAREAKARAEDLALTNRTLSEEAERLLRASFEDPLTGLQNRRRLDLAFIDLLETPAVFTLAMIDVDHFKLVNDRFSHPVGDAVLRIIAELLTEGTRDGDLIVRFGGEEFSVLMRDADPHSCRPDSCLDVCERLRASVAGHDWSRLHGDLSVTVSIGVACSGETSSHESLLALADFRLYAAKQAGRNRVVAIDTASAVQPAVAAMLSNDADFFLS